MARLVDTPEAFVYHLDDYQGADRDRRRLDDGVSVVHQGGFSWAGAIEFKKSQFNKEGATAWLKKRGLEVNDGASEVQTKNKLGIATFTGLKFAKGEKQQLQDGNDKVDMILMQAIPITPGTHKGFTFSRDVINASKDKLVNTRMVLQHDFDVPGDVMGIVFRSDFEDESNPENSNLLITSLVFDPEAAKNVRNGHFHSVSVSVFFMADEDTKLVQEIRNYEEVTLTDIPADPDANVVRFKDVDVPQSLALEAYDFYLSEKASVKDKLRKDGVNMLQSMVRRGIAEVVENKESTNIQQSDAEKSLAQKLAAIDVKEIDRVLASPEKTQLTVQTLDTSPPSKEVSEEKHLTEGIGNGGAPAPAPTGETSTALEGAEGAQLKQMLEAQRKETQELKRMLADEQAERKKAELEKLQATNVRLAKEKVAEFQGKMSAEQQKLAEKIIYTAMNSNIGELQQWFEEFLNMNGKTQMLGEVSLFDNDQGIPAIAQLQNEDIDSLTLERLLAMSEEELNRLYNDGVIDQQVFTTIKVAQTNAVWQAFGGDTQADQQQWTQPTGFGTALTNEQVQQIAQGLIQAYGGQNQQ